MRRFRLQATGLLVVSVLSGFVLSSPTRAADAVQLFAALPEETGVVVEVRHPIELIDKLLNHPRRAQLEQLPDVAKALKTPQVVMAQTGLLWLEGEIGTSWREALRVAMGDGVWFVGQEPQNAMTLIAKSPQPERLDKLIPLFATLAKHRSNRGGKFVEPSYSDGALKVYEIGNNYICRAGDYLVATNRQEVLKSIATKLSSSSAASLPASWKRVLQGKAADSDLAWYVQPEQLRGLKKTLHDADQPIENPGVAVLLGGILSAIDNQGLLSGAVALQNDALELSAVASVENSGAASPLVSVFFGDKHQLVAPWLETGSLETIVQLSTVRDLSRFWLQRGEILQERGAAQLDVADSQLSTVFGGFDIGDEILGALQPNQQIFVVAPRHADGSTSTGLPMVAIVWQLKPNSTAPTSRYRMAFQSAIALSNVERANRGGVQWELTSRSRDGFEILTTRAHTTGPGNAGADKVASGSGSSGSGSSGEDGAQWVQQQLPTIATSDHYVVIASHTQVADRLIDGLVKAGDELPACPDHQQTRIQFRGPEAHAWLQENREFLIAQNMLDKGATRQQAETAIDTLINIVGTMKGVALELAIRDGRLHARASLQLVEGATR